MQELVNLKYVISAIIYSGIGVVILALSFLIFDALTTKVNVWKELVEEHNIALAIFLGAMAIGISTIIAAAIHG